MHVVMESEVSPAVTPMRGAHLPNINIPRQSRQYITPTTEHDVAGLDANDHPKVDWETASDILVPSTDIPTHLRPDQHIAFWGATFFDELTAAFEDRLDTENILYQWISIMSLSEGEQLHKARILQNDIYSIKQNLQAIGIHTNTEIKLILMQSIYPSIISPPVPQPIAGASETQLDPIIGFERCWLNSELHRRRREHSEIHPARIKLVSWQLDGRHPNQFPSLTKLLEEPACRIQFYIIW